MLDDAFQAGTDTVLQDQALRPGPKPAAPEPKFSAWRTGAAVPRGAAAGAAESTGFVSDVLGAFGQVMAATDARGGGMFAAETQREREQGVEAARKLRTQGVDFSSEAGDLFRDVGRGYRPDPVTAHAAELLTFDASRIISKAVGYSLAGGPVLGAVATGADEGSQVADDLKQKGVDLATRTAVGAIQGAGTAVGVLAPVAGRTALQTAALVAASGPGTFVAQQSASRAVLQAADYSTIADQYDPFDPVGLAVSTLVPAAFGAYALRRARTAPADARPVVAPEQVDDARVAHQVEERRAGILAEPTDLPGQARQDDAISRAEAQMARGEPVRVPEVLVDGPRADAVVYDFAQRVRAGLDEARVEAERLAPARVVDEPPRTVVDPAAEPVTGNPATADLPPIAQAITDVIDNVRALTEPRPAADAPQQTPEARAMQVRTDALRAEMPDLQVQLDGMDAPMRLSDFLDRVKQEADADAADASLYQLAAECALTNGT